MMNTLLLLASVLTLAYDPARPTGCGDVVLPKTVTADTPAALLLHGGGWCSMDRKDVVGIADFLAEKLGYAVYNVNYRLAGKANPWPACGDDCVKAGEYMFSDEFAAKTGVKPKSILVIGGSAGGHLALWTGLKLGGKCDRIVSISGIADPRPDAAANPVRYRTLFGGVEPTEALFDSMSILKLVRPGGPKILLTHALEDRVVPIESARNFLVAYRAAGNDIGIFEYPSSLQPGLTGHCIWVPGSSPHRLIPRLEREIEYFLRPTPVPEPQPVKSDYEIMALYYPGTEHMPEWNIVEQVTPDVKPLLGWYDEGDPENLDWQIKWAVEHGISSFCVCWYWDFGRRRLEQWVNAFPLAQHRKHLKWCLLNCTWNFRPNTDTVENQEAMTRFWIDNYFRTGEYLRIDGKPVVAYCSADWTDSGMIADAKNRGETLKPGEGIRRALEISNRIAREAGFPGIYWVDLRWMRDAPEWTFSPEGFVSANVAGFDACTSYNLGGETPYYMSPEKRQRGDRPRYCGFELMTAAAEKIAERADSMPGKVPFWPVLPTGYDDLSRAFQFSWTVHGRTPEKFRACCEKIRGICDRKGLKRLVVCPINEWQEGSYAEPDEKFGFAMYDAIRDTFCSKPAAGWPKNVTPKELGLPLREYPPMFFSPVQSWTFDSSTEGWYRQPFGCPETLCRDGALRFITSRDFQFHIRQRLVPFEAKQYTAFRLRMRVKPDPVWGLGRFAKKGFGLRLKWGTPEEPIIGNCNAVDFLARVASAPVIPDGEWHEYRLDLSACEDWSGMIDELWFEAANIRGALVDIDWMRFE